MTRSSDDSRRPMADQLHAAGDQQAFIPYPPVGDHLEHVPIHVRPELHYYIHRMGFLPHTLRLYLHVPWIADPLFRINNAVMRDERNSLSEHFKYKLALVASQANQCTYCTSHHCATLQRRWDLTEEDLAATLSMQTPADEREDAAMQFVYQASIDPHGVTDEQRAALARHFSPQEVMEIVLVAGFWKMYNTMHTAMAAPIEDPVTQYTHWVNFKPGDARPNAAAKP